jgi:hypothetical protein
MIREFAAEDDLDRPLTGSEKRWRSDRDGSDRLLAGRKKLAYLTMPDFALSVQSSQAEAYVMNLGDEGEREGMISDMTYSRCGRRTANCCTCVATLGRSS